MFKLFSTKKVNTEDHNYIVYRKRRFGSCYPNLSKQEEYEMKGLFHKTQRQYKLVNIDHPNIYYKALYLSKNKW